MCVLGKNHLVPYCSHPSPKPASRLHPPAYVWLLLTKSPEALLFSRATLCSGEVSFLPDRCSKLCLLKLCTLTGCLPCSPSSNATNRSRPCIFHPLQSAGLSVSLLTSSIPEFLSPLGSGSSTWVQPLTVGLWNLPCAWEFYSASEYLYLFVEGYLTNQEE